MASNTLMFPFIMCSEMKSHFQVPMEHFDNVMITDAITCSEKCAILSKQLSLSEYCPDHSSRKFDRLSKQFKATLCSDCGQYHTCNTIIASEETQRLEKSMNFMKGLLEEIKQEVSMRKKVRNEVRRKKEHSMDRTREVFSLLRKTIEDREKRIKANIVRRAHQIECTLTLQLERLALLWTQLQNCYDLMKKVKVTSTDLVRRRKLLEQRQDHIKLMIREVSKGPVIKTPKEVEFVKIEHLCEELKKLGRFSMDPSKCEVTFPTAMMVINKEASLMITLKDVNGDIVDASGSEVEVSVTTEIGESIVVGPVKDASGGTYTVSFIPRMLGNHVISVIVDGQHIQGSPHNLSVALRNYCNMSELDCTVVNHYGGKEFGCLTDVAIGVNDEVVIADYTTKRVIVLDSNFALLSVIGQGSGYKKLDKPYGVAISKNGIIAVSDWGIHQVKKYSLQGKCLSAIGSHRGNNIGQFNTPRGLGFNSNHLLYVVDRANYRIQVFHQDDTFAFTFGSEGSSPGQFQNPIRISINRENCVLVSDVDNNYISLFSYTGSFISWITCDKPYSITVSPDGHIIAGCLGADGSRIMVWSPTHKPISQFGKFGSEKGEFKSIGGMAMNSIGTIYAAEYNNNRLQLIKSS